LLFLLPRNASGCETEPPFDEQENNDTIQFSEVENKYSIAKGLSDIIVYCQATHFNQERILSKGRNPCEMSSFCEPEKLMTQQEYQFFLWYHQVFSALIHVFPFITFFLYSTVCIGDAKPHLSGR
jgi:hypothetical protein